MEEKPFRVLLDLTEININTAELKYVWMYINPRELKTIFDFKRAIINKFNFSQENFKLFVLDGLLLENEKIAILQADDTVKLQYDYSRGIFSSGSYSRSFNQEAEISESNEQVNSNSSAKESKKRKSCGSASTARERSTSKKNKKRKKHDKYQICSDSETILNDSKTYEEIILDNQSSASDASVNLSKEKSVKSNLHSKTSKPKVYTSDDVTYTHMVLETDKARDISNKTVLQNSYHKQIKSKSGDISDKTQTSVVSSIDNSLDSSYQTVSSIRCNNIRTSKSAQESGLDNNVEEGIDCNPDLQTPQGNFCKKRKRKRKRKRKESRTGETSLLEESQLEVGNTVNVPTGSFCDKRKHIIYHSPTPSPKTIDTITLESNTDEIYFEPQSSQPSCSGKTNDGATQSDSDSCDAETKQNSYSEPCSQSDSTFNKADLVPKISTPISQGMLSGESWGITPLPKVDTAVSNSFSKEVCNTSRVEKPEKLTYSNCQLLSNLPPIGTRLAFKTLELNENYCPEVTQYKEGILKNIDSINDMLEIELVQSEIKPGRIGKFENLKEDEIPPPQVIKSVSISWQSLIDPRLIP